MRGSMDVSATAGAAVACTCFFVIAETGFLKYLVKKGMIKNDGFPLLYFPAVRNNILKNRREQWVFKKGGYKCGL